MSTIAWILVLTAGLLARQVAKGRVMNIGEDLSDSFLAIIQGDTKGFTAVLARTGDNTTADVGIDAAAVGSEGITAAGQIGNIVANNNLAAAAMVLGTKAKGYRFGATGPDYYDCSGLMYRAAQKVGYKGGRFTTFTIGANKSFVKVNSPAPNSHDAEARGAAGINDLVVWPTHHMGVVTGVDKFYSARNPQAGITEAKISGFRKDAPIYYRLKV